MRLGGWRRIPFRALGRAAALAALVLSLGACAAGGMQSADEENPRTPVVLRSIPRHTQYAPANEWVYLWDRPGGPSARAVRMARVPSGTSGLMMGSEPPRSASSDFLDAIGADNVARQPVNWVKVSTPRGEGWVRVEFVEVK